MIVPLTKNGVAVFTPTQWHLIENNLNGDYKIRGDFLLQTAMRISEAYYVSRHPECFVEDHAAIFLPHVAGGPEKFGKKRAKQKERTVLLSPDGVKAVKLFFEKDVGLPSYQAMDSAFKRAAKIADFDIRSVKTKSLRKTFISWAINALAPELKGKIASSAGHTTDTMDAYYICYGFKKEDIRDMKGRVNGWGEA
jgi:integrase